MRSRVAGWLGVPPWLVAHGGLRCACLLAAARLLGLEGLEARIMGRMLATAVAKVRR